MILVSGGNTGIEFGPDMFAPTELVDTTGSLLRCDFANLPFSRYGHTQTGLTACGGQCGDRDCETSCHKLFGVPGDWWWTKSHTWASRRVGHSAWASPQGIVLIGGRDSGSTSETLLENGDTKPGFSLEYDIE